MAHLRKGLRHAAVEATPDQGRVGVAALTVRVPREVVLERDVVAALPSQLG